LFILSGGTLQGGKKQDFTRSDQRRKTKMSTSFLTREGFQKLQDELDTLRTTKREEIATRLHEAIEGGELLDNAELEAAKNEQAFVEGRIKELEVLLATARVVDEKVARVETIQVGSKVTIQVEGQKE
jgi:transcription elongation factor GreA